MALVNFSEGYQGKTAAKSRITYDFIQQRLNDWMIRRNGECESPIVGHLCYCDISIFSVQKLERGNTGNNFSFSFTLSREDDGKEYKGKLENFLKEGLTIGRHPEFQKGLPLNHTDDGGKYDLGCLFEEVIQEEGEELRSPAKCFVSGIVGQDVVDRQKRVDELETLYEDQDLDVEKMFHKYINQCCKGFHDLSGRQIKYVIGIPVCKPPYQRDPEKNVCWAAIFIGLSGVASKGSLSDVVRYVVLDIKNLFSCEIIPEFFTSDELQGVRAKQRLIANEFAKTGDLDALYKIFLDALEHDTTLSKFKENICFFDFNIVTNDKESKGAIIVPGSKLSPDTVRDDSKAFKWFDESSGECKEGSSDSLYLRQLGDFLKNQQTIGGCSAFLDGLKNERLAVLAKQDAVRYLHKKVTKANDSGNHVADCLVARPLDFGVDLQNESVSCKPTNDDVEHNQAIFVESVAKGTCDMKGRPCVYYMSVPFMEGPKNIAQLFVGFSENYFDDSDREERESFLSAVNDIVVVLRGHIMSREDERKKLESAYTRAAIGSIMSRNGSHNIGSHVLSALSHNVGTMPDDRILYQYIQQRMDYIATVTTDFPNWSVSTRFVGDVMKTFFSQRHLLEHISESEGLHAYHFQGNSVEDAANNRRGAIQIKIFGYKEKSGGCNTSLEDLVTNAEKKQLATEFIAYDSNGSVSIDDDVSVAIPGGVVGQHAFYTILENFIRNTAKHSWASADDKDRNLVINIAFLDDSAKKDVSFLIWDDLSNANAMAQDPKQNNSKKSLIDRLQYRLGEKFVDGGRVRQENWGLAEMKISAGYLQKQGIDKIGGLPPAKKSHGSKRADKEYIIKPVSVGDRLGYSFHVPKPREILLVLDSDEDINALNQNADYAEMGIDCAPLTKIRSAIDEIYNGNVVEDSLDYSFIVYPSPQKCDSGFLERLTQSAPYRVVLYDNEAEGNTDVSFPRVNIADLKDENNVWKAGVKIRDAVYSSWIKYLVIRHPGFANKDETLYIQLQTSGSAGAEAGLISNNDVFWALLKECYHSLVLDLIETNDQSLRAKRIGSIAYDVRCAIFMIAQIGITNDEIYNLSRLEKDSVQKAESNSNANHVKCFWSRPLMHFQQFVGNVLWRWGRKLKATNEESPSSADNPHGYDSSRRRILSANAPDPLRNISIREIKMDLRNLLNRHFESIFKELEDVEQLKPAVISIKEEHYDKALQYACSYTNKKQATLIRRMIEVCRQGRVEECEMCKQTIEFLLDCTRARMKAAFDGVRNVGFAGRKAFFGGTDFWDNFDKLVSFKSCPLICDELCDAFEAAFLAGDILLRKYEERIVTLPVGYRADCMGKETAEADYPQLGEVVKIVNRQETNDSKKRKVRILYRRHDNNIEGDAIYAEALSGSQSYLNALIKINRNDTKLLMHLAETGLLRILIIDERADKFLRDHPDMETAFARMKIWVANIAKSESGQHVFERVDNKAFATVVGGVRNNQQENPAADYSLGINEGDFDILVIHQGIIDKWWPSKKHNSAAVGDVLKQLKSRVPYTVITTGRGRPDSIPKWAKVLPFSSIESLLFRKYPEKMLLVNAVMGVLPFSEDVDVRNE